MDLCRIHLFVHSPYHERNLGQKIHKPDLLCILKIWLIVKSVPSYIIEIWSFWLLTLLSKSVIQEFVIQKSGAFDF